MDEATQLHIFARRYCMERNSFLGDQLAPVQFAMMSQWHTYGPPRSKKQDNLDPRCRVLDAILIEIESLFPDDLPGLQQLAEYLIQAGKEAGSGEIGYDDSQIAEAAERDERDRFIEEIKEALTGDLPYQIPLFYRRVLSESEVAELWEKISAKWGADGGYWYPLGDWTHPTLVALDSYSKSSVNLQKLLRDFIVESGETRIFELREHGPENFLVDVGVNDFMYNGAEGFWVPRSNEWIIYCSHEDTITLGGSIVSVVKETKVDHRDAWWKQT